MFNQYKAILDHAEIICRNNQAKLTSKRRQILQILLLADKAISAYELMAMYEEHYHCALSPMSTYRILEFLESMQLAHKLNIANKYVACAYIDRTHDHKPPQFLICQVCQKVDELDSQSAIIQSLQQDLAHYGYTLATEQIELNCICTSCQSA